MKSKNKKELNVVHDNNLLDILKKLGVKDEIEKEVRICKFCNRTISFENIHTIFPESGDVKIVCNEPECVKELLVYVNKRKI